jgi:flagellin-like hook-associated protein FlgL
MIRISNQMMYSNALLNTFRNNQGLLTANEQLSSGKRVNRPSDDPTAMMQILNFRTQIGKADQYMSVQDSANSVLSSADSTLGSIHDELTRAKEIALQNAGTPADATVRAGASTIINNITSEMINWGNTKVGDRYIFSGLQSNQPAVDQSGRYVGSGKDLRSEIMNNVTIPVSVKASDFLTADLNPNLSPAPGGTLLASLNGGTGVPPGTFTITNRVGASAIIDTTVGPITDVAGLIAAINASGINVTASVSPDGRALTLTDTNATPTQALSITDGGMGTAQALGIAGTRNTSVYTGNDLNPTVSGGTLITDLYGGTGMALSNIKLQNGGASATVSFAGAVTVQDMLNAINVAGAGMVNPVTASIDPAGRSLAITSGNPNTVAFAIDTGAGKTADMLGIGGGRNVLPVLNKLSQALKLNDIQGILSSIDLLNSVMDNTSAIRGSVGARATQVAAVKQTVDQSKYENTNLMSSIEDTDFVKAASDLAMLQTAYQATLKSTASIIQPSLLDFVR